MLNKQTLNNYSNQRFNFTAFTTTLSDDVVLVAFDQKNHEEIYAYSDKDIYNEQVFNKFITEISNFQLRRKYYKQHDSLPITLNNNYDELINYYLPKQNMINGESETIENLSNILKENEFLDFSKASPALKESIDNLLLKGIDFVILNTGCLSPEFELKLYALMKELNFVIPPIYTKKLEELEKNGKLNIIFTQLNKKSLSLENKQQDTIKSISQELKDIHQLMSIKLTEIEQKIRKLENRDNGDAYANN
jgi:hypothetical protein